jgi:hypothetical protein
VVPPSVPPSVPPGTVVPLPSSTATVGAVVVVENATAAWSWRSSMRPGSSSSADRQRRSAPAPRALTCWRSSVVVAAGSPPRSSPRSSTSDGSAAAAQMRWMSVAARESATASSSPARRAASTASSRVAFSVPAVSVVDGSSSPDVIRKATAITATTTSGATIFAQGGRPRVRAARPPPAGAAP